MQQINLLIAPNSFKECADAAEIADEIKKHFSREQFKLKSIPISDGGDGFLKICQSNYQLKIVTKEISSFYEEKIVQVPVGISEDRKEIFLESAEILGMKKIPQEKRNPALLNSNNLGELLIKIENEFSPSAKIILGLGGTSTNDLGLGLCVPFGLKLFNSFGTEVPVHPKHFAEVVKIILPNRKLSFEIDVVTDVEIPLFGENGTSKTFAKQKGASDNDIENLEKGVKNILSILKKEHGVDFSSKLFGAGGGLLLGLSLISDLKVIFAKEFLLTNLQLEKEIGETDYIITGEGSFDQQSMMNKGTGVLVKCAKKYHKKIFVICGKINDAAFFNDYENLKPISLEKYFKTEELSIKNYKSGIEKACGEITSSILSHP